LVFYIFISFILHWGRSSRGLDWNTCIIFQFFSLAVNCPRFLPFFAILCFIMISQCGLRNYLYFISMYHLKRPCNRALSTFTGDNNKQKFTSHTRIVIGKASKQIGFLKKTSPELHRLKSPSLVIHWEWQDFCLSFN
jgi:hypothetical protein